jgi:rare lipoprotein A
MMNFRLGFGVVLLSLFVVLVGCSQSRYKLRNDAAPEGSFDFSKVPDAKPIWEPLSPQGNASPYKVNGKQYRVMKSAKGYVEEGISSWYGLKFHGELTSNGEVYNMYEMSAAHKTLPLPTYLRVTNLENAKSIVVRVNDRGPFHSDRIIDLSFAAANRLEFADKGTARVRLEAITPEAPQSVERKSTNSSVIGESKTITEEQVVAVDKLAPFVQVAAFSNKKSADAALAALRRRFSLANAFVAQSTIQGRSVYRVRVGPLDNAAEALALRQKIEQAGIGEPIVITRSVLAKER